VIFVKFPYRALILIFIGWVVCLIVFINASTGTETETKDTVKNDSKLNEEVYEVQGPLTMTVVLEVVYLDGEVSEEIKRETITTMEEFWAQYDEWELVHQDEEQVVFQKHVDDISPLLKTNGYFGISDEGTLSIFNGKPENSTEIIQSFFQLDIEKLESNRHMQLKKGIRVKSKTHYQDVIETFKQYSAIGS
jgi:forespore regulator of the sigma-K checkpoint